MNAQIDIARIPAIREIRTSTTLRFSHFKGLMQQAAPAFVASKLSPDDALALLERTLEERDQPIELGRRRDEVHSLLCGAMDEARSPNLGRALALADAGFEVFPCREREMIDPKTGEVVHKVKEPYTPHGFKDASRDPARIRAWWRQHPEALVGLPTGKLNGIAVLDLDRKDGKDGIMMLEHLGIDAASPLTIATPSGGQHRFFCLPETAGKLSSGADLFKTLAGQDKTGIDIRGDGGYVIVWGDIDPTALSSLPEWPQEIEAARKRDETERQARHEQSSQTSRYDGPADLGRIREALSHIQADDRETWRTIGMALKAELGDAGRALWDEWSRTSAKFDTKDQAKVWRSFKGSGVTIGSVFWTARQNGWQPRDPGPKASAPGKDDGAKNAKTEKGAATSATSTTFQAPDEPLPLFRELPKAEAFPVETLGATLGGMAKALHEAAVQSPMAICGTAVLAAAACATQALRDVELPIARGQAKPLSLYFLAIALSGERKTATDKEALDPIRKRSDELRRDYDEALPRHRNAFDAWTAERKKVLSDKRLDASARRSKLEALGREPAAPKSPILILQEPTLEGLTKHLKLGYPSVGLFSSEGGQFIGGHAMSDDAKRRSAGALNSLWDDGRLERIRATEEIALLPGRRVSVFLQAQPDVAQFFLADPILQDIGLLARFLITQPDTTMGSRKIRELASEHQTAIVTYGAKMLALLRRELPYDERGDGLEPPPLIMSSAARAAWIAFDAHLEPMRAPGAALHEISGFANKLPEHAARIAAVLQVFDQPDAEELTPDYLAHGIKLAEYYASEALRLHGAARVGVELKEAEKLRQWLTEKWDQPHVAVRNIQQWATRIARKSPHRIHAQCVGGSWLAERGLQRQNL